MTSPDSLSPSAVDGLDAEKLLAGALHRTPVSSPAFGWEPPSPQEVAPWFPEYEVLSLAGRGAMGAVYRAVQRKFDRPAAIKLLPADLAARDGVTARFEREARAMARLNHPNIVSLYDYGRTESGHLFIVMEYVEGADLSRLIHGPGLSVPQALEIVTQVCDALQYAHSRGFVHRDIKPGNVLVDADGRVKIADFGLAKLLGDGASQSNATMTGTVLGTPDYTAPEQLKGGPVDHRADIYSLGVMFYEMLTGDIPRGAWELPSKRTSAANTRLDEVVTRAMQTEPDKRYQQASEVKSAVNEARSVPPMLLRPVISASGRPRRWTANRVLTWLMLSCAIWLAFVSPTGDAFSYMLLAGPFWVLAFFFHYRRKPAGAVSGFIGGVAACATVLMTIAHPPMERQRLADLSDILRDAGEELMSLKREGVSDADPKVSSLKSVFAAARAEVLTEAIRLYATAGGSANAARNWQGKSPEVRYALVQNYVPYGPSTLAEYEPDGFYFVMPETVEGAVLAVPEISPIPVSAPSPRAIQDLDAVIDELADRQDDPDEYRVRGVTRYWTAEEEQRREALLKQLADKIGTRTATGFAPDDPRVQEARQRLAALEELHRAMKLPVLSPANCVNPEFRTSISAARHFPEGEVIPGVRLAFWEGKNQLDCAAYYVESLGIEPEKPLSYEEPNLEHYPDFWPLDMPLERPRLPVASPHSNAEMEWLMRQFPTETAADFVGLALATFDASGFDGPPQLDWMHWSRSSEDRIPWAEGEPRAAVGSEKGRLILKGGKCYTVFDTAPRPQLFGGAYADTIAWAVHLFWHAGVPGVKDFILSGGAIGDDRHFPREVQTIYDSFISRGDYSSYHAEIARSSAPWRQWLTDNENLVFLSNPDGGLISRARGPIPFHRIGSGRILVTRFVCSREIAEKIATACRGRLPMPGTQDELDALAKLVPDKFPVHAGYQPGDKIGNLMREKPLQPGSTEIDRHPAEATVPDGQTLTIFRWESAGVLRSVASRAVLILEMP